MTQLHALVINLIAQHDATLPASHGDLAHAAFMAAVDAVQPDLAQALHDLDGRKPFTLSPLDGPLERQGGSYQLRCGWRGNFRLTLLHSSLFDAFMQRLLASSSVKIRLGRANFVIDSVYGAPGSHPWCGYATTDKLAAEASGEPLVHLEFASPTSFSQKDKSDAGRDRFQLLPDPGLTWVSLRSNWQAFSGQSIPIEFERWVDRNVIVKQVRRWETRALIYRGNALLGGLGDVTFQALHDDPAMLRTWNLLADFAFFCGVGRKTTMGMGQCRRLV